MLPFLKIQEKIHLEVVVGGRGVLILEEEHLATGVEIWQMVRVRL